MEEKQIGIDKATQLVYEVHKNPKKAAFLINQFFKRHDLTQNLEGINDFCFLGEKLTPFKKAFIQPLLDDRGLFGYFITRPYDLVTCAHYFPDSGVQLVQQLEDPATLKHVVHDIKGLYTLFLRYQGGINEVSRKNLIKKLIEISIVNPGVFDYLVSNSAAESINPDLNALKGFIKEHTEDNPDAQLLVDLINKHLAKDKKINQNDEKSISVEAKAEPFKYGSALQNLSAMQAVRSNGKKDSRDSKDAYVEQCDKLSSYSI